MKKTITINISGNAFTIEEDAFQQLSHYLTEVRARITDKTEADEILGDIEFRISELLRAKCPTVAEIVTVELIQELIEVIGKPSDFGDQSDTFDNPSQGPTNADYSTTQPITKRLYRDPANRVLGGVCSGLAAYFNIDVVAVRVLFVIMTLTGLPILVYIGLWIAMQPAVTMQQRHEMMGYAMTGQKQDQPYQAAASNRTSNRSVAADGFYETFHAIGRAIAIVIGLVFTVVGLTLLSMLAMLLFWSNLFPHSIHEPFQSLLEIPAAIIPTSDLFLGQIAASLLIGIPLIMLTYGGIKLIFNLKDKGKWVGGFALAFWIVGLFLGLYVAVRIASSVGDHTYSRTQYSLKVSNSKKIYLETLPTGSFNWDSDTDFDDGSKSFKLKIKKGEIKCQIKPSLKITKGDSCRLIVEQESLVPLINKQHVSPLRPEDLWLQNDSVIKLNPLIQLNNDIKLLKIKYTLQIPDGYSLEINPLLQSMIKEEWSDNPSK